MTNRALLHLDTRELPIEFAAGLEAMGSSAQIPVLACASKAQLEPFGFDHVIEAPLGDYPAAETAIIDHLDAAGLQVGGVVAWTERTVELAARLAVRLGLPGSRPSAAANVRNKALTRELLHNVAGANPRHAAVQDEEQFLNALEYVGVPCLLKPAASAGGRGQFRIHDKHAALDTYRRFRAHTNQPDRLYNYYLDTAVVEELIVGSEHSLSGVVVNGEITILAMSDKAVDTAVPAHYQTTTPSELPECVQDEAVRMARTAVQLTGIDCCGFHVDFMVVDCSPKILEIGGRLGGDCINSHLIPLALPALKPYRILTEVAQGRNPLPEDDYRRHAVRRSGVRVIVPPYAGVLRSVQGLDRAAAHPSVRAFCQVKGAGERCDLPLDHPRAYEIAYVVAECALDENIQHLLDEIAAAVTVEVEADMVPRMAPETEHARFRGFSLRLKAS